MKCYNRLHVKSSTLLILFMVAFITSVMISLHSIEATSAAIQPNDSVERKTLICTRIELETWGDPGEFTLELILNQQSPLNSRNSWGLGTIHPKGPSMETNLTLEENYEKYGREAINELSFNLTMLGNQPLPQKSVFNWSLHITGNKTEFKNIDNIGFCVLSSFELQWINESYRSTEHPVFNQMADLEVYIYGQSCEVIESEGNSRASGTLFGAAGFIGIDTFLDDYFHDLEHSAECAEFVKDVISDVGGYEICYAIEGPSGYVTQDEFDYVLWRTAKTAQDYSVKAFWYIASHGAENGLNPGEGLIPCYETIHWFPWSYISEWTCDGYIGGTTRKGLQVFWWQDTCKGEIFNYWERLFTHRYRALFWMYEPDSSDRPPTHSDNPEFVHFRDYTKEYFDCIETIYTKPHHENLMQHDTDSSSYYGALLTTYAFIPNHYYSEVGVPVHFYVYVKVNYQPREGEYIKFYIKFGSWVYQGYDFTNQNGRAHFSYTFSQTGDYEIRAKRNDGYREKTYATAHITSS